MSRDEIRAVLDHHHPIIHTGMHILEEMHHLFKDIVPDILLIEMALSNEPDSLLDDSFGSVRPMTRVCVLRGYHNRAYVFGLLTSGSDGPLTDQDALEIINEATHDQHTGVAMSYNHRIVASKPTRQLKDQRSAIPALTTREIEVLHHLSVGKTNQAISQELSISEWTVRFHVKNIGSCWFTGEAVRLRGAGGAWGGRALPKNPPFHLKTNMSRFFKWNGLGAPTNFVGLDNFTRVLSDTVFRGALIHNILILVLAIALQLPLALGLALLVNKGLRGKTFFRTLFFLPYVLSDVITGVVWNFIYKPDSGLLNSILVHLLPGFTPQGWLGNPQTVLVALFVVMTWKYFGLHLLLFLAALQDVPVELEEAAAIDGATRWQTILRVIIPLMGSTARLSIYLSALGSIQIFDLVWVMTTGGPVGASETMATYMYKFGFQRFAIGYGSSVALAIFVFCLGISLIYQWASKSRELV